MCEDCQGEYELFNGKCERIQYEEIIDEPDDYGYFSAVVAPRRVICPKGKQFLKGRCRRTYNSYK